MIGKESGAASIFYGQIPQLSGIPADETQQYLRERVLPVHPYSIAFSIEYSVFPTRGF